MQLVDRLVQWFSTAGSHRFLAGLQNNLDFLSSN